MTTKEQWLALVSKLASEYYEQENELNESFDNEDLAADESGDVARHWIEDFGIWLQEGGWK